MCEMYRFTLYSDSGIVCTNVGDEAEEADLEVEDSEEDDAVQLLRHLVEQRRARPGRPLGSRRLPALPAPLPGMCPHAPHRQLSELLVPAHAQTSHIIANPTMYYGRYISRMG